MAGKGCKSRVYRHRDIARESSNPVIATALIILTVQFFTAYWLLGEILRVQRTTEDCTSRINELNQQIVMEDTKEKQLAAAVQSLRPKASVRTSAACAESQTEEILLTQPDEIAVIVHVQLATAATAKLGSHTEDLLPSWRDPSFTSEHQRPISSERTSAGGLSDDLQYPDGRPSASEKAGKALKPFKRSFSGMSVKALGSKLAQALTRSSRPSQSDTDVGILHPFRDTGKDSVVTSSSMRFKTNCLWGCLRPRVVSC
jgi:hypothetical protein